MTRKSTLVISHWSLVVSRWSLVVGHLTCREQYPKWDALLTRLSGGKTKAQKKVIMSEDISRKLANRREALRVAKESIADEDVALFGVKRKA